MGVLFQTGGAVELDDPGGEHRHAAGRVHRLHADRDPRSGVA